MNANFSGQRTSQRLDLHWTVWLSLFFVCAGYVEAQAAPQEYRLALDKIADGQSPESWIAAATHASGPLAQWRVMADAAPGRAKVLTIAHLKETSPSVFNLYWTKQIAFQNGELKVRMRANSGSIDQGGGLIWRVQDENNYYVARYNPLENNFRLYYVKEGARTTLASAEGLTAVPGEWVELRVAQHGPQIRGWYNNTLAWEINDAQSPKAGGVGLWTKADAASSFADFAVRVVPVKYLKRFGNE